MVKICEQDIRYSGIGKILSAYELQPLADLYAARLSAGTYQYLSLRRLPVAVIDGGVVASNVILRSVEFCPNALASILCTAAGNTSSCKFVHERKELVPISSISGGRVMPDNDEFMKQFVDKIFKFVKFTNSWNVVMSSRELNSVPMVFHRNGV